ncbi:MAG TPA: NAD-dependent epimerase/dehydratase family protein [Patescibacteria group bacterium]|nr:NAD-dependent epimerase/dehydratase family protein [Patescibacteria group bacterium]
MNKQIALVTGAGGFVGSNIVRKLILKKFEVHILVKKTTNLYRLNDVIKLIKVHYDDLSDEKKLTKTLSSISPNYIFHLATFENYRDQTKVLEMIDTNIIGTKNLLFASSNIPYSCFINTGSSSEYGLKKKPMKESDILEPLSFYAATKASATHLCYSFAKQFNKPIITFRLFSVYGRDEGKSRLIPQLINKTLNNMPISLTKGQVRHDFIYIDDVVDAYLKAIKISHKPGEIYNIGSGKQFTNKQVLELLHKISKKKILLSKEPFERRLWDTNFWVANISKTKNRLKWKPKYGLEAGLKKTYTHFAKNHV